MRCKAPGKLTGYENGQKIYESTVQYWMPFDGNAIGLHDADWQPDFGGTMYKDGYGAMVASTCPRLRLRNCTRLSTPAIAWSATGDSCSAVNVQTPCKHCLPGRLLFGFGLLLGSFVRAEDAYSIFSNSRPVMPRSVMCTSFRLYHGKVNAFHGHHALQFA